MIAGVFALGEEPRCNGSMIPACRARPRPGPRPLGIPVHHGVVAAMQARDRVPTFRAPVSHPALTRLEPFRDA